MGAALAITKPGSNVINLVRPTGKANEADTAKYARDRGYIVRVLAGSNVKPKRAAAN